MNSIVGVVDTFWRSEKNPDDLDADREDTGAPQLRDRVAEQRTSYFVMSSRTVSVSEIQLNIRGIITVLNLAPKIPSR